jgi:hypothetical protein
MRAATFILFLFMLVFSACSSEKDKPATAMDIGRDFIRASLNGDFKVAESLLLKDDENLQSFASFKTMYERMSAETKKSYKDANYDINKFLEVNDSVTIINYSNDFMKKPMDVKIVRQNNQWLVDFKYTLSGNLPID